MMVKNPETNSADEKPATDIFGAMLAEVKSLTAKVEALQAEVASMKSTGASEPYPNFFAHVAHVMTKHFPHDTPDGSVAGQIPGQ